MKFKSCYQSFSFAQTNKKNVYKKVQSKRNLFEVSIGVFAPQQASKSRHFYVPK